MVDALEARLRGHKLVIAVLQIVKSQQGQHNSCQQCLHHNSSPSKGLSTDHYKCKCCEQDHLDNVTSELEVVLLLRDERIVEVAEVEPLVSAHLVLKISFLKEKLIETVGNQINYDGDSYTL